MPVLVTMEFPATRANVEAVSKEMGVNDNPPDGLIVHLATEKGDTIQVVDVWETPDHFERFAAERLGPTVEKVMGPPEDSAGGPSPTITEAFDLVLGR